MKLPFIRGEGPVGTILCPSRELANQTYENVVMWCTALAKEGKYPQLNTLLCMGGISMNEQSHVMSKGLHIVVATPGRLIDMLEKKRFTFNNCKYLCMDEADRMIDLGFEDDVRNIMSFFKVRPLYLLSEMIMLRLLPASKTNLTVFCHNASKNSGFCSGITYQANPGECWACWCCKSGCAAGCGIRQTGSKDGLPPRVSAENTSARHYL
jgi:DEAD/DEAH box helicase